MIYIALDLISSLVTFKHVLQLTSKLTISINISLSIPYVLRAIQIVFFAVNRYKIACLYFFTTSY
jgi:hypothetical protein